MGKETFINGSEFSQYENPVEFSPNKDLDESEAKNDPSNDAEVTSSELNEEEKRKIDHYQRQFASLLEEHNWASLLDLSRNMFEDRYLLAKSELPIMFHELLYSTKIDEAEELRGKDKTDLSISIKQLIATMSVHPDFADYLSEKIQQNNLPSIGLEVFTYDEESDHSPEFRYALELADALGETDSKKTITTTQEMLVWMDKLIYQEEYEQIKNRTTNVSNVAGELKVIQKDGGIEWTTGGESELDRLSYQFEDNEKYSGQGYYSEEATEILLRNTLFEILAKKQDPNTISVVVETIKLQDAAAPYYFENVLEVFRNNNSVQAATELLKLAKSDDLLDKRIALTLLYKLHGEAVDVGQDGVEFLGKRFDLGSFNSPDYFIQRVTGNGEVGVFRKDSKSLQKYFQLQGLDGQQQELQAQLLELTYRSFLFSPTMNSESKEEQEIFLERFAANYFHYFDDELFTGSDVKFRDLSFAEQGAVVFIADEGGDTITENIRTLAKEYGLHGVKTLLSLDKDLLLKYLPEINSLGENKPKHKTALKALFDRYSFIVDSTHDVESYLQSHHPQELANSPELVIQIKLNIMHRANTVLLSAFNDSSDQIFKASKHLASLEREALLAAQSIKEFLKSGEKLGDIVGVTPEQILGSSLSVEDKTQMQNLYRANWQHKTSQEYLDYLLQKLNESFSSNQSRFYVLKHDNRIVAFAKFSLDEDTAGQFIHAGAFNVDVSYQGGKIGEIFLAQALQEQTTSGLPIRAETNPNNPMLKKYQVMGFDVIDDTEHFGEKEVKLLFTPKVKKQTAS